MCKVFQFDLHFGLVNQSREQHTYLPLPLDTSCATIVSLISFCVIRIQKLVCISCSPGSLNLDDIVFRLWHFNILFRNDVIMRCWFWLMKEECHPVRHCITVK